MLPEDVFKKLPKFGKMKYTSTRSHSMEPFNSVPMLKPNSYLKRMIVIENS